MSPPRDRSTIIAAALLIAATFAALAPVYSYDFFWHLATGRWITEHRALPLIDPFTTASDRIPWINGEWLFEVPLFLVHAVGGMALVAWLRALFVGAIFAAAFLVASRRRDPATALLLAAVAFAGGNARLDARPGTVAAMFVVAALAVLERRRRGAWIAYAALTVLWMNTHPSALLAPALAGAVALLGRQRRDAWLTCGTSAIALLVNPFGVDGVIAPLRLTLFARAGSFVNAEWLPSRPTLFPLFYLSVIAGGAAFIIARERREHSWRVVVFAALAYLAIAHVRNQGLYFAAFTVLIAPMVPSTKARRALIALAALPLAWVAVTTSHVGYLAPHRFPVESVARLRETGLRGNIYNPDQFGGYLIWSVYPERRALTDGRNELYHSFLPEYAKARLDSRAWHELLRKYRIDLAVDEYRGAIDTIDGRTGAHRSIPASLAYFPRRDWALIGYDDVSMVFARRAAFAREAVTKWELRGVVPDADRGR